MGSTDCYVQLFNATSWNVGVVTEENGVTGNNKNCINVLKYEEAQWPR